MKEFWLGSRKSSLDQSSWKWTKIWLQQWNRMTRKKSFCFSENARIILAFLSISGRWTFVFLLLLCLVEKNWPNFQNILFPLKLSMLQLWEFVTINRGFSNKKFFPTPTWNPLITGGCFRVITLNETFSWKNSMYFVSNSKTNSRQLKFWPLSYLNKRPSGTAIFCYYTVSRLL